MGSFNIEILCIRGINDASNILKKGTFIKLDLSLIYVNCYFFFSVSFLLNLEIE